MVCNITEVILNPEERVAYIQHLLKVEGLTDEKVRRYIADYKDMLFQRAVEAGSQIERQKSQSQAASITTFLDDILEHLDNTGFIEAPDCCYSGLALTGVPDELKPVVETDHMLIKQAVKGAGLRNYDPAEAPFNPQNKLVGEPQEVSDVDILMVVASQFFTFTNLSASSGGGMEERTANLYNKFPFIMTKKEMYVSRMTTGARRVMVLEYTDMKDQLQLVTDVIGTVRRYQPGVGTCSHHGNTLLGFKDDNVICLPGLLEKEFSDLRYDFAQYKK